MSVLNLHDDCQARRWHGKPPSPCVDVALCDAASREATREVMTALGTLLHTATHCDALQHTAIHCNILPHTATYCNTLQHSAIPWVDLALCNVASCEAASEVMTAIGTLLQTATHCDRQAGRRACVCSCVCECVRLCMRVCVHVHAHGANTHEYTCVRVREYICKKLCKNGA